MRSLAADEVLALWDGAAASHPLDRAAMLVAAARPELDPESIADLPLGAVTETLLGLRIASFGARIAGHVDCEHCGERLQFTLDATELLQPGPAGGAALEVEVGAVRLRAPSLRDLAAVAGELDATKAARALLARCTIAGAVDGGDEAMREVENALEALDPNADLALALHCAVCGRAGSAQLDAGALLWQEIDALAHALLREVDLLARAYGWSESAILAMTATRRARYVALAGG